MQTSLPFFFRQESQALFRLGFVDMGVREIKGVTRVKPGQDSCYSRFHFDRPFSAGYGPNFLFTF